MWSLVFSHYVTLCCLASLFLLCQGKESPDSLVIDLFHSIGKAGGPFTPRGKITVNLKDNSASQEGYTFSEEEWKQMIASSNDSSPQYFLAAASNQDPSSRRLSYTRVCSLVTYPVSEVITVNLDASGNFIAIGIVGGNPSCLPPPNIGENGEQGEGPKPKPSKPRQISSSVSVVQTSPGPLPDTQTYLQMLEQERMAKLKGQGQDNRSFLAKYWMYIVPLVIFMVISSATNPEVAGEAGGGR